MSRLTKVSHRLPTERQLREPARQKDDSSDSLVVLVSMVSVLFLSNRWMTWRGVNSKMVCAMSICGGVVILCVHFAKGAILIN